MDGFSFDVASFCRCQMSLSAVTVSSAICGVLVEVWTRDSLSLRREEMESEAEDISDFTLIKLTWCLVTDVAPVLMSFSTVIGAVLVCWVLTVVGVVVVVNFGTDNDVPEESCLLLAFAALVGTPVEDTKISTTISGLKMRVDIFVLEITSPDNFLTSVSEFNSELLF